MFTKGLSKIAGWGDAVKRIGTEVASAGKAFGSGLKSSGSQTVGNSLKLKGLKHVSDAAGAAGGIHKALRSSEGRKSLARAIGNASPSIGAAGTYAYGAKKVYDKTLGSEAPYMPNNYESYGM